MKTMIGRHVSSARAVMASMLLAGASSTAGAGELLDYIRNYDLNDYALGLAVSVNQSPYTNDSNGYFAYPYLTSFRNAAFTDDWLLVNDGDLGFRWVSENGWVLGAVGRYDGGGIGNTDSAELRGLDAQEWTVEAGPLVGWRGWPIHLEGKLYADILSRNNGVVGELAVSWPTEWSWGYLVPNVRLARQDGDYNDYYYGVGPNEARPMRPAYQPGASTNVIAQFRAGYALNDRWLLSGHVESTWLGSEITNSPIVDKDRVWSFNLGVAYNADVFRPRTYAGEPFRMPRFELRFGNFWDSIDSKVTRKSADGGGDEIIDIEDTLGADSEGTAWQFEGILRIGQFHRMELGFFELGRESTSALASDVRFGDEVLPQGAEVRLRTETRVTRVSYAYSIMNDSQKELGVAAGIHVTRFDNEIFLPESNQRFRSKLSTPLPVIGLFGNVTLGERIVVAARAQIFRMEFDNFEGSLNYLYFGMQYSMGDHAGAGIGYNHYGMKLDSSHPELDGSLELRHSGPILFMSASF